MIVAAAAELFRKRGYRGTSLEEIGMAVGTTGPAIYRHFASKEAILVELLERAMRRSQRDVLAVQKQALAPREALAEIVRKAVDHVLEETDLVALAHQEGRSLSAEARRRIARENRAVVGAWWEAVSAVRPALSPAEVQAICSAVFALIVSMPRGGTVPAPAARRLYVGMALSALMADPAGA
jgi:AcrR family transcriptional regulator